MRGRSAEVEVLGDPLSWLLTLGFGLLVCQSATSDLAGLKAPAFEVPGFGPRTFVIAGLLLGAAVYLAVALLAWRHPEGLPHRRALVLVSAVACCAYTAAQCGAIAAGSWDPPLFWGVMRSLVRGIFPPLIWIAWYETAARFDTRRVLVSLVMANALSALLTLFVSQLPSVAISAFSALALAGSVAVLIALDRRLEDKGRVGEQPAAQTSSWTFPAVPVLMMAVFTFANVFARNMLDLGNRGVADVGVLVLMAALIFVIFSGNGRFKTWSLYAIAFPLTLFGLICVGYPQGPLANLSIICIHAGDTLFKLFMAVVLCNIAYRWGASAAMLFGFAGAASDLASLGGGLTSSYAATLDAGGSMLLLACVGTGLAVCYVAFANSEVPEATWGISAEKAGLADQPERDEGEALRARCSAIAYQYGLTRREEQVIGLVARGYTAAQIEEELSVSNSTVKTHTNAVFHKLGVHSRKEIVDLVGGYAERET